MTEEIKPCPWCNRTEYLTIEEMSSADTWEVNCSACDITMIQIGTREEIIELWNQRPPAASVPSKEKILGVLMESEFYKNIIKYKEARSFTKEIKNLVNDLHALLTEKK